MICIILDQKLMDKQAQKNVLSIFFLSIFLVVTICGAFTYFYLQRLLDTNQVVVNIEETTRAANQALLMLTDAEAEVSNFVISHNPKVIENFQYFLISSSINMQALAQLVQNNPEQVKLVEKLQPLLATKINRMKEIISNVKSNNIANANSLAGSVDRYSLNKEIKILISQINQNESRNLNNQTIDFQNKINDINTVFIALLTVLIGVGLVGYRIINNYI